MMRICAVVLVSMLFFTGILVGIRFCENTTPSPASTLFTNSNGLTCQLPCLFGIQPNRTSIHDAIVLLDKHPFFGTLLRSEESVYDYSLAWTGTGIFVGKELHVELSTAILD